ncbi:GldM family protein [Winogradskyella ouciana]|uniref:GldM family protein n=1 Tax=Winogradskyella ouciana TaxID=2608631 RepID=UPI003D2ABF83
MKRLVLFLSLLFLVQSCKSSYGKSELLKENETLKERIKKLETADTVNREAAIELKKMNVVYRGVSNPIYITKPNAISFEATAPGLRKIDSLGNYNLNVGTGRTLDITIKSKLKNGDSLTETKTFRIKDISAPIGTINGIGCGRDFELKMTKNELMKESSISIKVEDFIFDWSFKVRHFKLKINDTEIIQVNGSILNAEKLNVLEKLKINDSVKIFDIRWSIIGSKSTYSLRAPSPILIRIIEDN